MNPISLFRELPAHILDGGVWLIAHPIHGGGVILGLAGLSTVGVLYRRARLREHERNQRQFGRR